MNFNTKECLARCLTAILKHATPNHQIIVVDNASNDGSPELVKGDFQEAQLISLETNRGYSAAVNEGFKIADSEFIFIINSDVYIQEDTVEILVDYLRSFDDVGLVGPAQLSLNNRPMLTIHHDLNLLNEFLEAILLWDVWRYRVFRWRIAGQINSPREVSWLSGAALMVRSSLMEDVGGMDENLFMYGEEYDLQVRCRKKGWRIVYVPMSRVFHEKGVSADAYFGYHRLAAITKSHYYVIAKNGGLKMLIVTVPLRIIRSIIRLLLGLFLWFWKPKTATLHGLEHLEVLKLSLSRSTYRWILKKLRNGAPK